MKLTKFLKLRKAFEGLDAHLIGKKIRALESELQGRGLPFVHQNVAITQEGIFYIDPSSGVATKVTAYVSDYPTSLSKAQLANLEKNGYHDQESIEKFHPYHLMRCNAFTQAQRDGWTEPFRIAKRIDSEFYYRIVNEDIPKSGIQEIYQEIENQPLYVCSSCLLKVTSILPSAQGVKREAFTLKAFFDVNMMHSWNSQGLLSKDFGFTKNMYPDDWMEICRIRKEQVTYHCESCFVDLSERIFRPYLHVVPSDHVEGQEGYVRLECLCIGCLAELPEYGYVQSRPEWAQYIAHITKRFGYRPTGSQAHHKIIG